MPKFALVVLDGLGDLPSPDTGGVSPIEAARTPNLDRLATEGLVGQVMVIGPGVAPESDAGALALLGINAELESPGRGVLEALGVGVEITEYDVAMRMNFATFDESGRVADARVGRSLTTDDSRELADGLTKANLLKDEMVDVEVRATVGHRGVVVFRPTGPDELSGEISNSDPFYERVGGLGRARSSPDLRPTPIRPVTNDPAAARTAPLVELWLERAIRTLPDAAVNRRRAAAGRRIANGLLLRQAGRLGERPERSFVERTGLRGAAVTEMPVERGIAKWLGLSDLFVGPMGPDRDRALEERAVTTRSALLAHDFVYVHLKGPDEPGHDGQAVAKKEVIEAIDRSFFGSFPGHAPEADLRVAVTADHSTPCVRRAHSDDPVPLVLFGPGLRSPSPERPEVKFGADLAPVGSIGTILGLDVLPRLVGTDRTGAS